MAEMLLINPRRRRRSAVKASAKRRTRRTSTTRRARRRNPLPAAAAHAVRRITRRRMANPKRRHHARRRRNPIGSGVPSAKNMMAMFKDAAIGGAGAVAFDILMGKINPMLPAMLQTNPNSIGVGDAVKAVITASLGNLLSKHTKGLSRKMAQGALTTQARDIISTFVPDSLALAGLGYSTPGRVVAMNNRIGPNRLAAYTPPGRTALLSGVGAYTRPGAVSPLLSAAPSFTSRQSTAQREGFKYR